MCTNVRMMDGKRPIFIDHTDSTFFFPYLHLRFLEIPAGEMQRHMAQGGTAPGFAGRERQAAGDADQRLAVPGDARRPPMWPRTRRRPTRRTSWRSTRTSCSASATSRAASRPGAGEAIGAQEAGATLPAAMPKNLVIVESPAKARTIERYLGADYQVLASYGHVRDLPENPGKGKFGVDVDHDFAPEYVVPEDRRKQVSAIEKAARGAATCGWPRTSTARARRSPGTSPRRRTSPPPRPAG